VHLRPAPDTTLRTLQVQRLGQDGFGHGPKRDPNGHGDGYPAERRVSRATTLRTQPSRARGGAP
jgi:hypothetical protein